MSDVSLTTATRANWIAFKEDKDYLTRGRSTISTAPGRGGTLSDYSPVIAPFQLFRAE